MNCLDVKLKELVFATAEYESMLLLRNEVLRIPLGRVLDEKDLEGEQWQRHFALVSVRGDTLAACLCVRDLGENTYKIRQMAVSENCRKRGLGRRLVLAVEQILLHEGAQIIVLNARITAVEFYRKMGYSICGKTFDEVGIPHVKMQKNLAGEKG
ncbi:MAG: GNAT family N-acetyltransferase [Pseudomonadales bacterium]|nr:GNAT family N-acetyltransferase [Pseudomonadales bacterium]